LLDRLVDREPVGGHAVDRGDDVALRQSRLLCGRAREHAGDDQLAVLGRHRGPDTAEAAGQEVLVLLELRRGVVGGEVVAILGAQQEVNQAPGGGVEGVSAAQAWGRIAPLHRLPDLVEGLAVEAGRGLGE